ncbi:MAG: dihydroorotase [Deltaproteobacteria bacterium]|nr:dihydroorotase [Deltaproteobacteria bacterium]MBW2395476.1 dihydroorotase [Deltaproteobacteria bacterium]
MGRVWIRGGRVIDPASGRDEIADVLLEDGRVEAIGLDLSASDAETLDAEGCWVTPGFIDLHAHLREPGQEYKEDLGSGGRAGAAGGFTGLCCMANTEPVNDDPAVTDYILDRARQDCPVHIYAVAAATKGLLGEVMTEMSALVEAGAVAFSDDGRTIMDSDMQRRVLEYSKLVSKPVMVHAEDLTLVRQGVVNEGAVSTRLGLPGNPAVAETVHVARDIQLAELTGAHLHVGHVSTAGAVVLIRQARERGVHVTAEVTPHHLTLTDEATLGFDTNTKMAPPLRGEADVDGCIEGLADGTLDAIATDHAPHAVYEKEVEFTEAPPGVLGFETAYPTVMELVRKDRISPIGLIASLTSNPARVFDLPGGRLTRGAPGDVTVLDPERKWIYDPAKGYSKSRNSPWAGQEMLGRPIATFVDGALVYHVDRGVIVP